MEKKNKMFYAFIGRWKIVEWDGSFERISSYSKCGKKMDSMIESLCKKVENKDIKKAVAPDSHNVLIVYMVTENHIFATICGMGFPRRICTDFLEDLKEKYKTQRPVNPKKLIKERMEYFNKKSQKVKGDVKDLKNLLQSTLREKIEETTENIEDINCRAEELENPGFVFTTYIPQSEEDEQQKKRDKEKEEEEEEELRNLVIKKKKEKQSLDGVYRIQASILMQLLICVLVLFCPIFMIFVPCMCVVAWYPIYQEYLGKTLAEDHHSTYLNKKNKKVSSDGDDDDPTENNPLIQNQEF